jgi:hypothetical protein
MINFFLKLFSKRLLLLGHFFILFIGKLIGAEGARLLWDQRASYLSIHLVRHATRKLATTGFLLDAGAALHLSFSELTARPAESEHTEAEINHFQEQQSLRKQA